MEIKTGLSAELVNSLEDAEIGAWNDFYSHTSDEIKSLCGIDYKRDNGVIYTASSKADVLALNRIVGFGLHNKPLTGEMLKDAKNYFIKMKVPRFFLQLCPTVLNGEAESLLNEHGFSYYNSWVRLYRETDPAKEVNTNLKTAEVKEKHMETFGRIVTECFGWPEILIPWFKGLAQGGNWHLYLAYDKNLPVATAAMFIRGDTAWFGMASTLPDYRRLGAQSALISRRIKDALSKGCKLIAVETAEDRPDHPAPSYHNALRMGFHEAYRRRNYICYN